MKLAIASAFVVLCACTADVPAEKQEGQWIEVPNGYAQCFTIFTRGAERKVIVFGPAGRVDTAAVLYRGDRMTMHDAVAIPVLERIAVLSTTHLSFLSALRSTNLVVAAADLGRVLDQPSRERIAQGGVMEIATADGIDRETLLLSRAQVIFDYPFGQAAHRSTITDLSFIPVTEYLEEHPLGRAEWIRFFGVLLGREHEADSLFAGIDDRYQHAVAWATDRTDHPRVFFGSTWQGQWHVPPGNSYMAQLIADAGGEYCFAERRAAGNIAVDLETVLSEGRKAARFGVILAHGGAITSAEMVGADERIATLPVISTGGFYLDSERSDIFGQALLEPEVLLEDLSCVLHPGKCSVRAARYVFRPDQ